jgi:molybdenum cofactor guanylyltransferase
MRVAGFVLTGGESSRMGRDKGLLPWGGGTLVERVAAEVREAAGTVAIIGRAAEYSHLGLRVLDEDFPNCGPLSGIEAALRQMTGEWALVTACDMPGLTSAWLRHLIAIAQESERVAVITSSGDGWLEPLCAVYHARLHADVRKALTEGRFSVREAIAGWSVEVAEAPDRAIASNVNTPEEWAEWIR